MLMFAAVSAFISVVSAGSYGGHGASAGSYGGYGVSAYGYTAPSAGFVLAPVALGRIGGCGGRGGCGRRFVPAHGGVVNAAVQTHHHVEYREAPSGGIIHPTMVEVDASPIPVQMVFRSASSLLNVQQNHFGSQGSIQESRSEDEPHILRHEVTKPVIQEIREVVTPFRKIAQEIRPVQEQVDTVVARGVGNAGGAGGFGFGGGNGAGGNGAVGNAGSAGGFGFGGGNGGFSGGKQAKNDGNSFALGAPAIFSRNTAHIGGGNAPY